MIIIFVGTMGSGKSLSMVKEAYNYYLQGFRILTNMTLNFPSEIVTAKDIQQFAKNQENLYNTVILIDELHIFMDSRRSGSTKNVMGSYFVTQTRKQKVKLLATTQHRHQIDRRVRDNTDCFIDCEKIELPINFSDGKPCLLITNHVNTRKTYHKTTFIGNTYFDKYDTEEIIFDNSLDEDEKPKKRKKKEE